MLGYLVHVVHNSSIEFFLQPKTIKLHVVFFVFLDPEMFKITCSVLKHVSYVVYILWCCCFSVFLENQVHNPGSFWAITVWNTKNFDLMKLLHNVGSKDFISVNKLINCTPPAL
jgi:hypothetical protein